MRTYYDPEDDGFYDPEDDGFCEKSDSYERLLDLADQIRDEAKEREIEDAEPEQFQPKKTK